MNDCEKRTNGLIRPIDRRNTNSMKWDMLKSKAYPEDTICLWVADTDFVTLQEVRDSLVERAKHAAYGYSKLPDDYYQVVSQWMKRRYDVEIVDEWIVTAPGNVSAIKMAIQAFTQRGDSILIQPPVYYQFMNSIKTNKRVVVTNPLINSDGFYLPDLEDMEQKIIENQVKMFIFCNPHNPVGKNFSRHEIEEVAKLCLKHQVMFLSDEVHSDFVFDKKGFFSVMRLDKKYLENTIVFTGPNKTFNLAGLKTANIIIPNSTLREKYQNQLVACGIDKQCLFGSIACRAAYLHGDAYVDQLKEKILENYSALKKLLEQKAPKFKLYPLEATYLAWLDVSALGVFGEDLKNFLIFDARVWVDEGEMFGDEGRGFVRINLACEESLIEEAVERIVRATEEKLLGVSLI